MQDYGVIENLHLQRTTKEYETLSAVSLFLHVYIILTDQTFKLVLNQCKVSFDMYVRGT